MDDGLEMIDEELEIIGLLKSQFNPKVEMTIDLDTENLSEETEKPPDPSGIYKIDEPVIYDAQNMNNFTPENENSYQAILKKQSENMPYINEIELSNQISNMITPT